MAAALFEVDKDGLAAILARRGKEFILYELVQNAWDEKSTKVTVDIVYSGHGLATLSVTDDNPDGFRNLRDAYTLFAPSAKRGDKSKRGRFNLGEKCVVACCKSAFIKTTSGTVHFDTDGVRRHKPGRSITGSTFQGALKCTREEVDRMVHAARRLIQPDHIETRVNGLPMARRVPVAEFKAKLMTEIADDEGQLRRVENEKTVAVVRLYDPLPGESASIYELGIPVVETGDRWHIDIGQKVPLTFDRDNVLPSFLAKVRALALNETITKLNAEEAREQWVSHALEQPQVEPAAVREVVTLRHGENRVILDPSDREANHRAVANGYTAISGGAFSRAAWENIRAADAAAPAGQVFPTPKPFSPTGAPVVLKGWSEMSPRERAYIQFAKWFGLKLLGREIAVDVVTSDWNCAASFGPSGHLHVHEREIAVRGRLRYVDLLIHEFGHFRESNHLSEAYYNELTELGAKAVELALQYSDMFQTI